MRKEAHSASIGGRSVARLADLFAKHRPSSILVGVSGTDSAIASLMCHRAIEVARIDCQLRLVHFGAPFPPEGRSEEDVARILSASPSYRWVPRILMPWLRDRLASSSVETRPAPAPGDDYSRWSELLRMSVEHRGWAAAPINATEEYLGNYSNLAKAASIWPISDIPKGEILEICREAGVPDIAIQNARQADCDCGRDDLAAAHIADIDALIEYARGGVGQADVEKMIDASVLPALARYVMDCLRSQGFKAHTPYRAATTGSCETHDLSRSNELRRLGALIDVR